MSESPDRTRSERENSPVVIRTHSYRASSPVRTASSVRRTSNRTSSPSRVTSPERETLNRTTSPVRGTLDRTTSPNRTLNTEIRTSSPNRQVISTRNTSQEEKKITPPIAEEKLNLSILPPEILQHIAEMLGYNDIRTLTKTFKSAAIIRTLPIPLGNIEITTFNTFRYFSNPEWNITELKIKLGSVEEFKLPNHMYTKLNKLELIFPGGNSNLLANLFKCINLSSFTLTGPPLNGEVASTIILSLTKKLTTLIISGNVNIDPKINFPVLQHLTIRDENIPNLDFIQFTPKLLSLDLSGNNTLKDITGLKYCPNLTSLNVLKCRELVRPTG
jgi:hypothetical protein